MTRRGSARSMAIGLRLPWSTGCTQGLWTRRLAHEAMGTAQAKDPKAGESDVDAGSFSLAYAGVEQRTFCTLRDIAPVHIIYAIRGLTWRIGAESQRQSPCQPS
jgi:hypothetical protein